MTRLILALNVASPERAKELLRTIGNQVDLYKIGIDLWTQAGPQLVKEFVSCGAGVFLDLKFADIPSVVAKAVAAASDLGIKMLTVHTMGGAEMLLAATKAAKSRSSELGREPPLILGVTVLTSLDRAGLFQVTGCSQEIENRVLTLAELAQSMGCDGVIASPKEIKVIKKRCGPKFIVVTPGIRIQPTGKDNQTRFLPPKEAAADGADYIVVGRPIYEAKEPLKVIEEVKQQLSLSDT